MKWIWMDMNSYFASVEQYLRPELRNRPIGVIPVETDSTCVIAASYEAKHHGVKTGTGVRDARRLCPRIRFVKARPATYVKVHYQILKVVDESAPIFRVHSIDEWTIQLRGREQDPQESQKLAKAIKEGLLQAFGPWMTSSMGISTSQLLAKLGSNLQKPNGLTLLPPSEMPERMEHLPLRSLTGIGSGMEARFQRHGIRTIRDLWEISQERAIEVWGSISGARWWAGFHGIDEPEPPERRQSMSHGKVLEPRLRNEEGARCTLIRLLCKLGQRLRQAGYLANSLQVSVSSERGSSQVEKVSLPCADDTPTLLEQFDKAWRQREPDGWPIKKVNVCVSGLVLASQVPRSLFDEMEKPRRLSKAMDQIHDHWGTEALYPGVTHDYREKLENKIAFTRIPDDKPMP